MEHLKNLSTPVKLLSISALALWLFMASQVENSISKSDKEKPEKQQMDQIKLIAEEMILMQEKKWVPHLLFVNEETKDKIFIGRNKEGKIIIQIENQNGTISKEQITSLHKTMRLMLAILKNGKTSGKEEIKNLLGQ